ncbi:hypothetical protein FHX78_11781 [Streptomyces capillispiralis]|uniref:Uncharacterized protein n=1 Tax=Streptomyces capillispiralis TaxID=68182 RepID=A0A561T9Q9_9ACTN|nr:hypothetical protein FHX78_11781 [Streptomyces capillispiralis]
MAVSRNALKKGEKYAPAPSVRPRPPAGVPGAGPPPGTA